MQVLLSNAGSGPATTEHRSMLAAVARPARSRLGVCCVTAVSIAAVGLICAPAPAEAHPHIWVTVVSEFVYDSGKQITAVRHKFTFDEMFSTTVVEGLDTNGDGKYSRDELAALAKENVESLKDFGYFTNIKVEDQQIGLSEPVDYFADSDDKGLLSLNFTLPVAQPIKLGSLKLSLTVEDPTFFISFGFAAKDAILMASSAPSGCVAELEKPEADPNLQKLDDAFAEESGGLFGDIFGGGSATTPAYDWPAQTAFLKCGA